MATLTANGLNWDVQTNGTEIRAVCTNPPVPVTTQRVLKQVVDAGVDYISEDQVSKMLGAPVRFMRQGDGDSHVFSTVGPFVDTKPNGKRIPK